MFRKILVLALVLGLCATMVAFLACKKGAEKVATTTEGAEPTAVAPPPPAPMEDPIKYVATMETVIQTITTNTAIKQAVSCLDASINLLSSTGDENLIVLLCTKTLTLIDAISPSYPSSAAKFDSASADLLSLINILQTGSLVDSPTWQASLKKHKTFLSSLITTVTTTTPKEKKLTDFYTKDELDKMKLKFKEYGDDLKKKYAEMTK